MTVHVECKGYSMTALSYCSLYIQHVQSLTLSYCTLYIKHVQSLAPGTVCQGLMTVHVECKGNSMTGVNDYMLNVKGTI
jgi:hypothetical protein